ncbi:uncharacterized protein LOC114292372 [Camellia sinensis]|uniref:PLAC8 family protein n=1 Tax=Camellia sinensis var. sinensis TaxID=542762 RepID=A0A4S4DL93_CAMSN|nr:uncharacterized protein LOC114292372 [Camellia sinensis]THG03689.1 hypothetical protein TEA_019329 [Camellia sinensis var. sinensis]
MVSIDNGGNDEGIEKCNGSTSVNTQIPLHISMSQKGLITDENPQRRLHANLAAQPKRTRFLKFQRIASRRDQMSRAVRSSSGHVIREQLNRVFSRKMDWGSICKMGKEWIKDPMNMALFVWIVGVGVSGALLFLVMTGMLNSALLKKSERDAWFEVNNQILNALFTLMCLYQHPKRIYHLILLFRWRPDDISKLRMIYCKNGTYKPHEWAHMMVVVALLHINCFAQYALCSLNLGYKRSVRPAIGVGICISVAIAAPAIAGVYCIVSPLGKDYHSEMDEESQAHITTGEVCQPSQLRSKSLEKRFSFASRDERIVESTRPMWSGGVLDFWDDISLAYLSLFCSFCVFGWNMERLGFGNMYVHIATFLLFCTAPFWIFNLAAVNINNESVREALGVTGVFLCVFGLLYGGFWRIQMRKRFNLPPYNFCCSKADVADFTLWLFCCWCSLAQEVRTANSYDVVEQKFCTKQVDGCGQLQISPLPREDGDSEFRSGPSSPHSNISAPSQITKANSTIPDGHVPLEEEESHTGGMDETMTPPLPSLIQREAN